jgi:hypothetical protein
MALVYSFNFGLLLSVLTGSLAIGLPLGVVAGSLFAALLSEFVSKQTDKFQAETQDFHGEPTLHAGPANHFKGLESVGGHLWLTNGRLHFRSHKMNLQNHEWSAPLADIVSARPTKTLGLIPNGLRVHLSSGEEHRFVVNGNEKWAQDILTAKQAQTA